MAYMSTLCFLHPNVLFGPILCFGGKLMSRICCNKFTIIIIKLKQIGVNMAKRFTDTSKWRKTFFRTLPNPMKLFWLYILDECDHAGIWEVNIELFNFQTGLKVIIDDVKRHFGDKLYWFDADTKLHVQAFIDFQYGALNPENRAHLSVIHIL